MPISFQPAAPFDAGLSAYGGAANATLQGNQLLAQAYAHRAQMQQQQVSQEMAMKAQAAGEQGQLMQRDRQFDATLREKQDGRFAETGLAYDQMAFKGEAETAQLMAQQQQQQEHAQLDVWANSQKMSQVEKVRLEQQKNGVGALKALYNDGKGSITKEDMYDGIAQLQTGINVGENRLKREQAETLAEAKNTQMEKTKVETAAKQFQLDQMNAVKGNRVQFKPNDAKRPEVESEVSDYMPDVAAAAKAGDPAAKAKFDGEVMRKMQQYGYGGDYWTDSKGDIHPTEEYSSRLKAETEAAKHAGTKGMSQEDMVKHSLHVAGEVSKVAAKAAELGQAWDDKKLQAENDKMMEMFLKNLKTIQSAAHPEEGVKAVGEQSKLNTVEKMKTDMSGITEGVGMKDDKGKIVGDRLFPEERLQVQKNLTEIMGLIQKYGTIDQVKSPEIKKRMQQLVESNDKIVLYGRKEAPTPPVGSYLAGRRTADVNATGVGSDSGVYVPKPYGKVTPIPGNYGTYFYDERGRTFYKERDGTYTLSSISRNR